MHVGGTAQALLSLKLVRRLGLVATVSPERLTPQLYPVSVSAQPPFTMLVNLVDHGDLQAGDDVSSVLTNFGTWQPSLAPHRGPSVLDVLMGGLGSQPSDRVSVPSVQRCLPAWGGGASRGFVGQEGSGAGRLHVRVSLFLLTPAE